MSDDRTEAQERATAMPKWLRYGLIGKGVVVIAVTLAVLYDAGAFG